MVTIDRIIKASGIDAGLILNLYVYGSRVYGTFDYQSDYDFIMIADSDVNDREIRNGDLNIHIYNPDHFQDLIHAHKIFALECLFLPADKKFVDKHKFSFKLNKPILREEISSKSSNSWVKCKKKLEVENEAYIGKKSLFHSMRIVIFGIQLAKNGCISNYSEANHLWEQIKTFPDDWNALKTEFQPLYNSLLTEFRKYAPKI